jgi:hypothetical protein
VAEQREPELRQSFGDSATTYAKERAFGAKALEILRDAERYDCYCDMTPRVNGTAAPLCLACALDAVRREMGLLEEDAPRG